MATGDPGALRVRAIQELEQANLAPIVSDKFGVSVQDQQPFTMTINTNSFSSTSMTNSTNTNTSNTTNNSNTTNTSNTTNNSNTTNTCPNIQTTTSDNTTTTGGGDPFNGLIEIIEQSVAYFETTHFAKGETFIVVGGGIRAISDLTVDAKEQIRTAQKVYYCLADPVTERRLHTLNETAESLYGLYANDKPRINTYEEMVEPILRPVRNGQRVCAVFYGHPGVFAWSTHKAIRIARQEGFRAEMHAGISADASLFADLGLDPSQFGCHSLEATDFLIRQRVPDICAHLLLWQVECVGDFGFNFSGYKRHNFHVLIERLHMFYPTNHPVVIYEAAQMPHGRPKIIMSSLGSLVKDALTGISTLYIPPLSSRPVDKWMCSRLGI